MALIAEIRDTLDDAVAVEANRVANRRSDQIVKGFVSDHPDGATCDQADRVIRDIDRSLDDSQGDEAVRRELSRLRTDFRLSTEPLAEVADFGSFVERLKALKTIRHTAYHPEPENG